MCASFEQLSQRRFFGDQLPQPFFVRARESRVMLLRGHHAERSVSVRERNQPRPDIRFRRMHADADLLPVELARDDVVLHVHEQRRTLGKIRRAIEVEQPRQRAAEAAGIEHEPRPMRGDFIAGPGRDHGTFAGNVDRGDLHFVADRRAAAAPLRWRAPGRTARAAPGT